MARSCAKSEVGSECRRASDLLYEAATGRFQYGACANLEACPGIQSTSSRESATYGKVATTLEASGLQLATTYHYRLLADDEHEVEGQEVGGQAASQQGTFTTAPLPVPQAATTAPSAVGATSATIAGSVDPDGQPAAYAFELGVNAGAATQYGIVYSAASAATGAGARAAAAQEPARRRRKQHPCARAS
ncbi:MAG TPA: hypothetical protein VK756_06955 [Solirubrobacteraceae bacterium]|jgi:hypothetical protein|nr:hypothetical protein [Solirubrobacteraceae bacterium]